MRAGIVWVAVGLLSSLVSSTPAGAAVTFLQHLGSTDPSTEGWTGSGGIPILDDAGSGFDVWATVDDTDAGAPGASLQLLSDETIELGNTYGWTLSARVRVVELPEAPNPDEPDGSPAVLYRDGSRTWQIHFGISEVAVLTDVVTPSGLVISDVRYSVPGGLGVHRLYELKYDAGSQTADLFVDDVEVLSNLAGAPFGSGFPIPKSIYWGSASTADTGQGNFNLVQFEVGVPDVPGMSPIGLLAIAGLLLGSGAVWVRSGTGRRT